MNERVCIIGVGLIGGSLARALKRAGISGEITGAGRDEAALKRAVKLGVVDRYETDIARAAADANMVVAAVPVGAMEEVFRQLAGHMRPDAVLTDVGSAKSGVVAAAKRAFGTVPANFVPGHPIAGTEKSGVEASSAGLFDNRRVILTPLPQTAAAALTRVRVMWEAAGAEVVEMDVGHHDEVLAATSHLPHVLAYALVDTLARLEEKSEIFRYAAGGFRDFTRIASSDPVMWRDICLANRNALLNVLTRFRGELDALIQSVRREDSEALMEVFSRAKRARDRFCEQNEPGVTAPVAPAPKKSGG